jgi:hypothetical protein
MKRIINLSSIINNVDDNVLTYNGSSIMLKNNLMILAYRATQKPNVNMPSYPYQQMNGSFWYNVCNYIGIVLLDVSKTPFRVLTVSKYVHTIYKGKTNQQLYNLLSKKYPEDSFSSLLAGPEDPRLYIKNDGSIYMNYNQALLNPEGGCKSICVSMFEIKIDLNILKSVSGGIYPEKGKKLICKKVNDGSGKLKKLFDTTNQVTIKNWSYSPGYFIDSYKDNAFLYKLINFNDPTKCNKEKYDYTMMSFIQSNWGVALTTPTVEYKGILYGVAHIRIKWSDIIKNLNDCKKDIQNIIKKNDIHHSDFYFMSIYKIDKNVWSMSPPILITGNTQNNLYYSYNVNFPCGVDINNKIINVTFGLGDCILMYWQQSMKSIKYFRKQFDYTDLNIENINDNMISKNYINPLLCNNINFKSYLLPKHIRLFDLGGSGLKSCRYDSVNNTFSSVINIGQDDQLLPPSQIIRKKDNVYNINIDQENLSGWGFGFSLAGINKLWIKDKRKIAMKNYIETDTATEFGLTDTNKIIRLSDGESHLYGIFWKLQEILPIINVKKINILNIAIGTGINISFSENGNLKYYDKDIPQNKDSNKYFWDIKINNKSIRAYFLSQKITKQEFNQLIGIFLRREPNNIKMKGEKWPITWSQPDIITFSGGGSNKIKKFDGMKLKSQGQKDIPIYIFPDSRIPYMGLVWKFMNNICDN